MRNLFNPGDIIKREYDGIKATVNHVFRETSVDRDKYKLSIEEGSVYPREVTWLVTEVEAFWVLHAAYVKPPKLMGKAALAADGDWYGSH